MKPEAETSPTDAVEVLEFLSAFSKTTDMEPSATVVNITQSTDPDDMACLMSPKQQRLNCHQYPE